MAASMRPGMGVVLTGSVSVYECTVCEGVLLSRGLHHVWWCVVVCASVSHACTC